MKIYTASSWRNSYYQSVVDFIRKEGHEVYDFRNTISTRGKETAFNWDQIDVDWENWEISEMSAILHHDLALNAFRSDYIGMLESDVCVLILPSGKSSHIEAGFMKGMGKKLIIFLPEKDRPELTYSIADSIVSDLPLLGQELQRIAQEFLYQKLGVVK